MSHRIEILATIVASGMCLAAVAGAEDDRRAGSEIGMNTGGRRSEFEADDVKSIHGAMARFATVVDPLRGELYRYCLSLTRTPWDAEDLTQECLSRAFVRLGQLHTVFEEPRSYLFRIATNAWIDQLRRHRPESLDPLPDVESDVSEPSDVEVGEALAELARQLPPRERICVLLKDVFGFRHEEIAGFVHASPGAVKTAVHRGRKRLKAARNDETPAPRRGTGSPSESKLVDLMITAFNAHDVDALVALMGGGGESEIIGVYGGLGEKPSRNIMVHTFEDQTLREAAKVSYRGEPIIVLWYEVEGKRVVRDILRVFGTDDRATLIEFYYYCPDTLRAVCDELGLPVHTQGYRHR